MEKKEAREVPPSETTGTGVPTARVLLVDDLPEVAGKISELLDCEKDISLTYCPDPMSAVQRALDISPTVILQDMVMPGMDGLTLVRLFKAHPRLKDIPLVVLSSRDEPITKADAFSAGANDYLVKIPDPVELAARIRYHSKAYGDLLAKTEAYRALAESQKILADEVKRAAHYVTSLLPPPLEGESVSADWRFFPSASLGGDSLGYHWIDSDHFAMYILDASGHGIGSALLSVSALNMIRSHALPETDFTSPSEVLTSLNRSFQMDRHDNLYFTLWYGVFNRKTGKLSFSGAGHPPPLLVEEGRPARRLPTQNPFIGLEPDASFISSETEVSSPAALFVFSDGAYEIMRPDGSIWSSDELASALTAGGGEQTEMDSVYAMALQMSGLESLEDDFTILKINFNTGP